MGTSPWMPDLSLFALRLGVAWGMLYSHGWGKWQRLFSDGEIQFADPIGLGEPASLALAVFSEFVCALLVILGLFHRAASFFLAFTMLVAFFIVHGGDPFADREMAFLYGLAFLFLMFSGPGKYALDAYLFKKKP